MTSRANWSIPSAETSRSIRTLRENVRAFLRSRVRRILRKHGYPPDMQEKATQTVLEQAGGAVGRLGDGVKNW